jgi:gamma-glutamylcyclotransferase (GGCT)/AIG2-like uncharacterized protein YtfP
MAKKLAASARFLGAGRVAGRLYNLGRFPGLKPARSTDDWVEGDLYHLGNDAEQTFREMDAYENAEAPESYKRRPTTVVLDDGRSVAVWVYWYYGVVREEALIASGSYEDNCDEAQE